MYAFAQRNDTKVVDEPLYGHYLTNVNPKCFREYRKELLQVQKGDGDQVVQDLLKQAQANATQDQRPVLFLKHMSKQFSHLSPATESTLLSHPSCVNIFLIRQPVEVFDSFNHSTAIRGDGKTAKTALSDTGLPVAAQIAPRCDPLRFHVVDYKDLVTRPEGTLRALCKALGLEFDSNMLHWSDGPKEYVTTPQTSYFFFTGKCFCECVGTMGFGPLPGGDSPANPLVTC